MSSNPLIKGYQSFVKRMSSDFRLMVLTYIAIVASMSMIPFASYRYSVGNHIIAFTELVTVIISVSICLYAWFTNKVLFAAKVMTICISIIMIVMAKVAGLVAMIWLLCGIHIIFCLVKPKFALTTILLTMTVMLLFDDVFDSELEKASYVAALLMTTVFSYLLVKRLVKQQEILVKMTRTDSLTAAGNRRAADEELSIALQDFYRTNTFYSIAIIDIDYFKKINDEYGHVTGDKVLINLVKLLINTSRSTDRIFRIGGEEFLILSKLLDKDHTIEFCDKIRSTVSGVNIVKDLNITISIGATNVHVDDDIESWIKRADEALYTSKTNGRNRSSYVDPPLYLSKPAIPKQQAHRQAYNR